MQISSAQETRKPSPYALRALLGRWSVDPQASHARFLAGTLAGLVKVPGSFHELSGDLVVDRAHAAGHLAIESASIDTGNRMRDGHLRSRAFFDAKRHRHLRYEVRSIWGHDPAWARVDGELVVAGRRTELPLDVGLRMPGSGLLELACHTQVDRIALGIRGARTMVPRAVELDLAITLRRALT
jgi:polyisoprenoid-binding protein YceI